MNLFARKKAGHRGKNLEAVVIASQGSTVILEQFPTPSRRIPKPGGGWQVIQTKGPVDIIGEVIAGGRAIHLDCKECEEQYRFPIGKADHFPEHQRFWLQRHGQRGNAIAGLLIEATHPAIRAYFWLDWRDLFTNEASIEWSDKRMLHLGSSRNNIDFSRIIAAEWQRKGIA